jgi:hypothetical protein
VAADHRWSPLLSGRCSSMSTCWYRLLSRCAIATQILSPRARHLQVNRAPCMKVVVAALPGWLYDGGQEAVGGPWQHRIGADDLRIRQSRVLRARRQYLQGRADNSNRASSAQVRHPGVPSGASLADSSPGRFALCSRHGLRSVVRNGRFRRRNFPRRRGSFGGKVGLLFCEGGGCGRRYACGLDHIGTFVKQTLRFPQWGLAAGTRQQAS